MVYGQLLISQSMSMPCPHHPKTISNPHGTVRDTFIYEYIGDVVSHPSFMKRMRDYAGEGIKHFYFMMLQKDEVSFPLSFLVSHSLSILLCGSVHRCD